jgi:UDP-GlcNAc3NAcA epimerase
VESGWNRLVGADRRKIVTAVKEFAAPEKRPVLYGTGETAERCVDLLSKI